MDNIVITYDKDRKSIIKGNSWTYTDSLNLAEVLNTDHKEVLKRIRKTLGDYKIEERELKSPSSDADKFIHNNTDFTYEECFYKNSQNKLQPFYKLSKDLLVLVIFSFRKLERAQVLQKAYIAQFNAMEKELHWWRARYLGIDVRNDLTDAIKEYCENPKWYDYVNFTDLVYQSLYGKKTKQIRNENGLEKKANVRKYLSEDCLNQVKKIESEISVLMSYEFDYSKNKLMMNNKYTDKNELHLK
ncbi:Rha family transcriptional regulator [Cytobacillus praedii]|uniref:Rha family transcriptional regulator n=1 Tax=Cytobacillus praedii TaxID=1742358 RepID=UPI002E1BB9A9|nr:Rha family transcriptional regulator [Cytobacillus praedii]